MNYKTFIDITTDELTGLYSKAEAKAIAVNLLSCHLRIPNYKYLSEPQTLIPSAKLSELQDAVSQLVKSRPLQYVLGYTIFAGNKIKVGEGVLIPRPETEELFNLIVEECSDIELEDDEFNILDACTGSGCLAYSLAAEFPRAQVYGCDISNDALKIACKQKVRLDGGRPVLFRADILCPPPAGLPQFDMIVSNPPYVLEKEKIMMHSNVLDYEPHQALFVPDDDPLKFYKALREWTSVLLKTGGRCYFEINEVYGPEVAALFPGSSVIRDINGKDRFVRYEKR
ncbi:MAG: peptide chain release factor N(5)-glutamine methyltransferase [Bacteroidales bacterium]|nr:peptide chain release factor N(5)-glutamine methyltransferase [Bacteroidales bacterium]MDD4670099.1 peptide chain release factor N(5)-glutamine methyltransferase [Bacteroidales bacterium]